LREDCEGLHKTAKDRLKIKQYRVPLRRIMQNETTCQAALPGDARDLSVFG
jgi:hypothetical protein